MLGASAGELTRLRREGQCYGCLIACGFDMKGVMKAFD